MTSDDILSLLVSIRPRGGFVVEEYPALADYLAGAFRLWLQDGEGAPPPDMERPAAPPPARTSNGRFAKVS